MSLYSVMFYLLGIFVLASTTLAVTRKNPVHAVVFLIISFLGSAVIYFLLGAPFLAALEVIIYAGAIMILFLFLIMMLRVDRAEKKFPSLPHWLYVAFPGILFIILGAMIMFSDPEGAKVLKPAKASPAGFGRFVFENYWLGVEIVSLLLLIGLLAAVLVGRGKDEEPPPEKGGGK